MWWGFWCRPQSLPWFTVLLIQPRINFPKHQVPSSDKTSDFSRLWQLNYPDNSIRLRHNQIPGQTSHILTVTHVLLPTPVQLAALSNTMVTSKRYFPGFSRSGDAAQKGTLQSPHISWFSTNSTTSKSTGILNGGFTSTNTMRTLLCGTLKCHQML